LLYISGNLVSHSEDGRQGAEENFWGQTDGEKWTREKLYNKGPHNLCLFNIDIVIKSKQIIRGGTGSVRGKPHTKRSVDKFRREVMNSTVHIDDTLSTTSPPYEASQTSLEGRLFVSSQHRTRYERDVPLYTKYTLRVTLQQKVPPLCLHFNFWTTLLRDKQQSSMENKSQASKAKERIFGLQIPNY
jgi:hypothetical protein